MSAGLSYGELPVTLTFVRADRSTGTPNGEPTTVVGAETVPLTIFNLESSRSPPKNTSDSSATPTITLLSEALVKPVGTIRMRPHDKNTQGGTGSDTSTTRSAGLHLITFRFQSTYESWKALRDG